MTFFNTQMKPNIAMPSFGPDLNLMEVQNYLLFIVNFYEIHMNNLKSIIIQQNETIASQKAKIRVKDFKKFKLRNLMKESESFQRKLKSWKEI